MKGQTVPSLFSDRPSELVDWSSGGLILANALEPWPSHDGIRYAAVSAFGLSGTNAQAIIAMPSQEY